MACYGPVDLFGNDYLEVKTGISFEYDGKKYEVFDPVEVKEYYLTKEQYMNGQR